MFYVYVYLDPRKSGYYKYSENTFDYEPFYIGKGLGDRCLYHLSENSLRINRNRLFINKLKKILNEHLSPIIVKVYKNISEKEALVKEKYLIKNIGRRNLNLGPLCNLTDGGEGISGYKYTEKQKETNRNNTINYWSNLDVNKKEERFEFLRNLGRDPKSKKIVREKYKKRLKDKSFLEKIKQSNKKMANTEKEKNRRSQQQKKRWAEDKYKEVYREANSKTFIITDPKGNIFSIRNLRKFCIENNISYNGMYHTFLRKQKTTSGGWKCYKETTNA